MFTATELKLHPRLMLGGRGGLNMQRALPLKFRGSVCGTKVSKLSELRLADKFVPLNGQKWKKTLFPSKRGRGKRHAVS